MPPLGENIAVRDIVLLHDESNSSLSSTLTRLRLDKKPAVSFSENVRVGTTVRICDMTEEEYRSYWIDSNEFRIQSRSADISSELFEVMGKTHHEDDDTCYRGLETRTTAAINRYTDKYFEVILAVLDEQDVQRYFGFVDDLRIATACRSKTQLCQQEALLRAMEDQLAAVASQLTIR
jgi:hypothetical protein